MINLEKILKPGNTAFFLLNSTVNPNTLFQCKGIVKDVKMDMHSVEYIIKVTDFYDDIDFIIDNVYHMQFYKSFKNETRTITIPLFDSIKEFNDYLKTVEIEFAVNYFNVFNTKPEMEDVFNQLNYYFVSYYIKLLEETACRSNYKGVLRINSKSVFESFLKELYKDRFTEEEFNRFYFSVTRSKHLYSQTYDRIKAKRYRYRKKVYNRYATK